MARTMHFEPVLHLKTHQDRCATLDEGGRLWVASAFCDSVSLMVTFGGLHSGIVVKPDVARAIAHELLACAMAMDGCGA